MQTVVIFLLLVSVFYDVSDGNDDETIGDDTNNPTAVDVAENRGVHEYREHDNREEYKSDSTAEHTNPIGIEYNGITESDIVHTKTGRIKPQPETVMIKNGSQVKVNVFWAIPFAKPPVADLRFRAPVPVDPWDDVVEATAPPNACMQVLDEDPPLLPNPESMLSEDCLYLTIWRPQCTVPPSTNTSSGVGEPLATMLFIFGGGYMTGSSTTVIYRGSILAASQCIIVASMNYRLGALGLLLLDIPEAPGNMALLDVALALKWIKENVQYFGGSPDSITLVGFSAGGTTASMFLLSPLTRDMFKRAIIQSGSPTNHLAVQSKASALEAAITLSKSVNCFFVNYTQIVECLRKMDAGSLTRQHAALSQAGGYAMTAVVDHPLVLKDPVDLLESGDFKKCDILLGSLLDEGTFFMRRFWPKIYDFHLEVPKTISDQEMDSKLATFFDGILNSEHISRTISEIKQIYQLQKLREDGDAHRILLNNVITDVLFTCRLRQIAGAYARASQNVYLYSFNHAHDWTNRPWWVGAMHGSELDFVFGRASVDTAHFSPAEAELSETVMNYWGNFIKYGNPSPEWFEGVKWPIYHFPDPGDYLQFTPSAQATIDKTEDRRCVYWNNLPREYFKY